MKHWKHCRTHRATKSPNGYALLVLVFFTAVLLITLAAAWPNLITEDRREKEVEMIWRGKQYVRGIRLYYLKLHHFPTQLDDLYKPRIGVRFMRRPYKDPMNTVDGTWRIINAGPVGQINGSLAQPTNPVIANANSANVLDGPATSSSPFGGTKNPPSTSTGTDSPSASSVTPTNCQASPSKPANSFETPDAGSLPSVQTPQCSNTPQPAAAPLDANSAFAQTAIIGVGSKINKRSIIWLKGEKNYLHFEFIWKIVTADPSTITPDP